jgi:hypothetical protein
MTAGYRLRWDLLAEADQRGEAEVIAAPQTRKGFRR